MTSIEYFPEVDENGKTIRKVTRTECHAGSFILHPVVHLHVFNTKGELYLQKRALNKDIQPGKWDTSVGGHVDYGEEIEQALQREVREELGIENFQPIFLTRYKFVSHQEAELVHSYFTVYEGFITPNKEEISEGKFWTIEDIEAQTGKKIFTPNFEQEWKIIVKENLPEILNQTKKG